jgi:hypothetical protein
METGKSWAFLPAELLETVFSFLTEDEVKRECKSWKLPAQRYAYSILNVEHLDGIFLVGSRGYGETRTIEWLKTLKISDQTPWDLVKTVECGDLWKKYLKYLADTFPAVENLIIEDYDENLYTKLVRDAGKWTRLTIPFPEFDEDISVC